VKLLRTVCLLAVICAATTVVAEEEASLDQCIADPTNATFRIFQTRNIWTFLKLDTRTGLVWQVQWGNPTAILPINGAPLAIKEAAQPGRFTLCATRNIFTFLLLDQQDGRLWGVQWSTKDKERFISPLQ
jgi:hypothetical protein